MCVVLTGCFKHVASCYATKEQIRAEYYKEFELTKETTGLNYDLAIISKEEFMFSFVYGVQDVTERCGQTLGTSSTYQNKKKCPHEHVSGDI
jgi:hypothetical protein